MLEMHKVHGHYFTYCFLFFPGALDDFDKTPISAAREPAAASSSATSGAQKVCLHILYSSGFCSFCF